MNEQDPGWIDTQPGEQTNRPTGFTQPSNPTIRSTQPVATTSQGPQSLTNHFFENTTRYTRGQWSFRGIRPMSSNVPHNVEGISLDKPINPPYQGGQRLSPGEWSSPDSPVQSLTERAQKAGVITDAEDKHLGFMSKQIIDDLLFLLEQSNNYNHWLSLRVYDIMHFKRVRDPEDNSIDEGTLTSEQMMWIQCIRCNPLKSIYNIICWAILWILEPTHYIGNGTPHSPKPRRYHNNNKDHTFHQMWNCQCYTTGPIDTNPTVRLDLRNFTRALPEQSGDTPLTLLATEKAVYNIKASTSVGSSH
jgi:hypothetical protein